MTDEYTVPIGYRGRQSLGVQREDLFSLPNTVAVRVQYLLYTARMCHTKQCRILRYSVYSAGAQMTTRICNMFDRDQ